MIREGLPLTDWSEGKGGHHSGGGRGAETGAPLWAGEGGTTQGPGGRKGGRNRGPTLGGGGGADRGTTQGWGGGETGTPLRWFKVLGMVIIITRLNL